MMPPRQRMLISLAGGVFVVTNVVATLPTTTEAKQSLNTKHMVNDANRPPKTVIDPDRKPPNG